MEISLLTGVNLILTIFDKQDGQIIQYLSDSLDKFKAIALLDEITIKRRYLKDNAGEEIQSIRSSTNIYENDLEEIAY